MRTKALFAALAAVVLGLGSAHFAEARDQIRIVGSSTVYPFSSYVAEEFGATTKNPTPVVESTGSGGGHKLFSEGPGLDTPDITNSSRRMKDSEFDRNVEKGVQNIHEVVIGYDGIAVAHHIENPALDLSRADLLLALAEEVPVDGKLVKNPYKTWNEVNPKLPAKKILVYGPPTTSGTRDAFEELVMHPAAKKFPEYPKEYDNVRQDGVYVPAGENDNLIVQKLAQDKDAIGIFGYSFLAENGDRIQGATIEGTTPEPANISSGAYPVSRSLFFYVKMDHIGQVPGIDQYVDMFLSEAMIGPDGVLKDIGLIPLPDADRAAQRKAWQERTVLTRDDLK